jgi:hypothetical protein
MLFNIGTFIFVLKINRYSIIVNIEKIGCWGINNNLII